MADVDEAMKWAREQLAVRHEPDARSPLVDLLAEAHRAGQSSRDAEVAALKAENERLREALASVANMTEWSIIEAAVTNVRQAIKADIRRALRTQTSAALEGDRT